MNKVILSVDSGKYLSKAYGITEDMCVLDAKRVSLRSKYYDLLNGDIELAGNSFKVIFDENEFIVGEQGTIDSAEETSKATLIHKLCIYTLVTEFLKPGTKDNEVYMVLACPLNLLKSTDYKESYKNFIMNDGNEINIVVNGENYIFKIKDITIKSEGSGVLYLNKEKFENKQYGVIDIGGLNMQFCLYINGVPQPNSRFTAMTGSSKLVQDIKDNLEVMMSGKPVSYSQAEEALRDKQFNDLDESRSVIKKTIKNYIKLDVIKAITDRRISLDTIIPLAIGGTCEDVKDELKNSISNIQIQDNPQWASVEGLFKIAYTKYK